MEQQLLLWGLIVPFICAVIISIIIFFMLKKQGYKFEKITLKEFIYRCNNDNWMNERKAQINDDLKRSQGIEVKIGDAIKNFKIIDKL